MEVKVYADKEGDDNIPRNIVIKFMDDELDITRIIVTQYMAMTLSQDLTDLLRKLADAEPKPQKKKRFSMP